MSHNSLDDVDMVNGTGENMVIKTQPELPKYAQQPMPIGEKVNLKFEVSCGRPVIYEWLKQGVKEEVVVHSNGGATHGPVSGIGGGSSVRSAITPVSNGRELIGEVVEGGEGITSWQYVCRAFCPSTGEQSRVVKNEECQLMSTIFRGVCLQQHYKVKSCQGNNQRV